jgi:hypothetical protein
VLVKNNLGLSNNVKVLKKELERQGYNNTLIIAQKIQQKQKFKFDAGELNYWHIFYSK